ncbi:OmpA family protein [Thaumasiovibrio subtropicus]|uniref:OmpA family protein n=1 Tax=Thaumasiovibrio subtropicus TaxID=1891207 RepID=UPI000B356FD2|nr:OmpA family protein [Thaumasiovibrio subtropicus]
MKLKYSVLPLTALMAFSAIAEQSQPWYVGARVGNAHYTDAAYNDVFKFEDRDSIAGGVFFGYNFKPWFAIEAGYTDLGEAKLSGVTWDIDGFDIVGKASWDLTENTEIFGKFGGFRFDNKASGLSTGYTGRDGWATTVGAGLEYFFNNDLSTRLEYQYYADMIEADAHFWGLSLVYNFGGVEPMPVEPAPMPEPEPEPEPMPVEPMIVEVEPITRNLYFAFDSGELTQDDVQKLVPVAERLRTYPNSQLYVIGHTDSRGSAEYNQKLSEKRATTVAAYLEQYFNIEESRIFIEGRGEEQPIATNETDEGRQQNRRVEVFTPGFSYEK